MVRKTIKMSLDKFLNGNISKKKIILNIIIGASNEIF